MLTDEQKRRIESLSTDEMAYEVALGNASRFQREKFAYLKACYRKRLKDEKSTNVNEWHSTALGKIAVGVVVIALGAGLLWILKQYLNINL